MFFLNVFYHTKQGECQNFLNSIKELGIDEKCRAENGCMKYDYYFSDADENELLLVETWESREHQQAHTKAEHTAALQSLKEKYVESTEIKCFEEK